VSRYQKGKTSLDFTEARDSEWKWHQLDHMQVCILLQTDNLARTPPLKFFTGEMPFLPPNQQRQSTEGPGYATLMPNSTIHTRPDWDRPDQTVCGLVGDPHEHNRLCWRLGSDRLVHLVEFGHYYCYYLFASRNAYNICHQIYQYRLPTTENTLSDKQ